MPELQPFSDAAPEPIVIPGSQRIVPCPECGGKTTVACRQCGGKGEIERMRKVKESDGSVRNEAFREVCPVCHGYGKQPCDRCEGKGHLLEEQVFTWSRHGRAYFTEDDLSGLHRLTVQTRAQQVYQGHIDPYEARWYQVAPLKELLDEAIKGGGPDSRLITADLLISGVPVSEVDYRLDDKSHSLALIGFANEVRGDLALYDLRQAILYALVAALAIALVVVFVLR